MARLPEARVSGRPQAVAERQLHVALDNMPGALTYTDDDLNIIFCNDRFKEMYPVPGALLEPGRPYPAFLRYLAEHGYYGEGDIEAEAESAGELSLKGFHRPVAAHNVLSIRAEPSA